MSADDETYRMREVVAAVAVAIAHHGHVSRRRRRRGNLILSRGPDRCSVQIVF